MACLIKVVRILHRNERKSNEWPCSLQVSTCEEGFGVILKRGQLSTRGPSRPDGEIVVSKFSGCQKAAFSATWLSLPSRLDRTWLPNFMKTVNRPGSFDAFKGCASCCLRGPHTLWWIWTGWIRIRMPLAVELRQKWRHAAENGAFGGTQPVNLYTAYELPFIHRISKEAPAVHNGQSP